jgi:Ni2+-binding GTPase involved in maturation of urease and hydrogenase
MIDLILVGGFLGAGKTTLLHAAAAALAETGRRVGLITNDQAPQLVDSAVLRRAAPVAEVAGSCFCCDFNGFIAACEELIAQEVDTILAEPVGSCTDLSATIVQPLKERFGDRFHCAPLSVLADPDRLREAFGLRAGRLHQATAYIYRLQLEEADLLLIGKADSLAESEREELAAAAAKAQPALARRFVSARSGEGLQAWLTAVLAGGPAGRRILTVDYDRYAEGEAVLGWLNATVSLTEADPELALHLITGLRDRIAAGSGEIGHLKALLEAEGLLARAQCVGLDEQVSDERSGVGQGPARLIINARVQCPPVELEHLVREQLAESLAACSSHGSIETLDCFSPGYPRPTHRYDTVVEGPST